MVVWGDVLSNGKLKITCGDLNVELEADNDLLYRSFSDMRIDGSFSNNITAIKAIEKRGIAISSETEKEAVCSPAEVDNTSTVIEIPSYQNSTDLPDFNALILEKRSFSTSNWMLFMAWSVSHKGKIKFTKKQIRKIYNNSCKHIGLRSKDFVSNFMLLLLNDYIVRIEKNTFELSDSGYKQAYSLLTDTNEILNEAI